MNLKNKYFLVTGADGFIGSHTVEKLVDYGAKVIALVKYNSWSEIGYLKYLPKNKLKKINLIFGDLRDKNFLTKYANKIEYVIHLSSLISIPYSYDAPDSYIETNIIGLNNLLSSLRDKKNLKRFVQISTSEVYGTAKYVPMDESHPLSAQSPYSASKIGADAIAYSYYRSFNMPIVIARPFNTYGPRQTTRAIIPTIISQLIQGKTRIHLGSLKPTRDLNYVEDTANGIISLALCKKAEGEVVNIASSSEISISDLLKKIAKISGNKITVVTNKNKLRPKSSEVYRLFGSNKKIKKLTGWKPKYNIQTGLLKTYNWFKLNKTVFDFSNNKHI